MKRPLIFAVFLIAFLVWTFPHGLALRMILSRPSQFYGLEIAFDEVRPALPFGYRCRGVRVAHPDYSIELETLYVGLESLSTIAVTARACGGEARARIDADPAVLNRREGTRISIRFSGIDPSSCVRGQVLKLSGQLDGELELSRPHGRADQAFAETGTLRLVAPSGTIEGYLPGPGAGKNGPGGLSIGRWTFNEARLNARIKDGAWELFDTGARVEGIQWELDRARLWTNTSGLIHNNADFRARSVDGNQRSEALLALLPRATQSETGWRRYRLSGNTRAPKLIGLK
ncbi:MAG: type II secretion system protein GspN [Candidatus Binatia bacterium]